MIELREEIAHYITIFSPNSIQLQLVYTRLDFNMAQSNMFTVCIITASTTRIYIILFTRMTCT